MESEFNEYFTILLDTTVCPRSSDPFYKVTYNYKKWATTSWTDGMLDFEMSLEGPSKFVYGWPFSPVAVP